MKREKFDAAGLRNGSTIGAKMSKGLRPPFKGKTDKILTFSEFLIVGGKI